MRFHSSKPSCLRDLAMETDTGPVSLAGTQPLPSLGLASGFSRAQRLPQLPSHL